MALAASRSHHAALIQGLAFKRYFSAGEPAQYEQLAADHAKKKDELKAQAEQDQKGYDAANFSDDQFDFSDTLLAISIALLAVTDPTHFWWLYFIALVPTGFSVAMGLAGLAGWGLHPAALIRLLS